MNWRVTCFLAGMFLCLDVFQARGELSEFLFNGRGSFQQAVIPVYCGKPKQLAAVIRIEKSRIDHERRGFFRVGVLPVLVLDGVVVEIENIDSITNSLVMMDQWVGPQTTNRIEFRRVKIVAGTDSQLEAGRIRFGVNGRWELSNGVSLACGSNQVKTAEAVLQVTGKEFGNVIIPSNPPVTNHFPASIGGATIQKDAN